MPTEHLCPHTLVTGHPIDFFEHGACKLPDYYMDECGQSELFEFKSVLSMGVYVQASPCRSKKL